MQLLIQYYCLIAKPKSISLIDWLFTNGQVCVVSSLLTFDISFLILIYVNWQNLIFWNFKEQKQWRLSGVCLGVGFVDWLLLFCKPQEQTKRNETSWKKPNGPLNPPLFPPLWFFNQSIKLCQIWFGC